MLKNKYTYIPSIVLSAAFLTFSIAYACSPVEPTILIRCSNMEVSIGPNSGRLDGETYEGMQKRWVKETIDNLLAIAPDCEEDLTPVLESFQQDVTIWLDYENKRGAFLDGDLILEPYSVEKEGELSTEKSNLFSCSYREYKHIGNWLIIFETSRPYCHTYWFAAGMCPSVIFSLGHFFFYLTANFSLATLPHFIGLLIAGSTTTYAWWIFLKNRPKLSRLKIISLSIVVLIVELFLIVMPFWLWGQIIGWVLFIGVLVLWYKYLKNGEYVSNQKAG